ncbi:MAG: hypothetical protein H0W99_05740 [Acidobacteria bacterium]|nr:hypothetical protein [Acidobacteriota bacterium]
MADDLADQDSTSGDSALKSERMTFAELCDYCEKPYHNGIPGNQRVEAECLRSRGH